MLGPGKGVLKRKSLTGSPKETNRQLDSRIKI